MEQHLSRVRHEAGLTQKDLGARLDHSPSYISKLEREVRDMSIGDLEAIAWELGRHPLDLVTFRPGFPPPRHCPCDHEARHPARRRRSAC